MFELLITDFLKNKTIQLATLMGLILDILCCQTINHISTLFGLPYFTSIILKYLMKSSPVVKSPARISEQFKPQSPHKIKIIPK
jgi:hypothetical protein